MSRELIDVWLDGEIDEADRSKLETWLQEDPSHRREFLEAVTMEEELRLAYRQRQPVLLEEPSSAWREWLSFMRRGWVPLTGLAAVILLVNLVGLDQHPADNPRQWQWRAGAEHPFDPTARPMLVAANKPVTILRGAPQLKAVENDDPKATAATVTTAKTGGAVRWGNYLELELEPNTGELLAASELREQPYKLAVQGVVNLQNGRVRIKQLPSEPSQDPTATCEAVEVVTAAGRIVAVDADFVVARMSAPSGTEITVTVKEGEVKVLQAYQGQTLRVRAGETLRLPAKAR
jgi:hypothetical protein